MGKKIKAIGATFLIMHVIAFGGLFILAIIDWLTPISGWIRVLVVLLLNIMCGIAAGYFMCRVFYKRRLLRITVGIYWISYVLISMAVSGLSVAKFIQLVVAFLLLMISSSFFL